MAVETDFYYFPDYSQGQPKRLVLLQVDIEGHSRLSREERPADVMKMKVELAEALAERLKAEGYGGVGWQGDGGMFALDITASVDLVDKTVPAWRAVRHVADQISKRYRHILAGEQVPLRTSAHVCDAIVHPDPRYWHSEGLNAFAKAERDLGRRGRFVITGELYRELPEEAKQEFTELIHSVPVGLRSDIYEFSAGVPGDRNMALKMSEMELIRLESGSFRAAVKPGLTRRARSELLKNPLLIIVDLQQDFSGDRPLAVEHAEEIAERNAALARAALKVGYEVVVTRDWHPENHFSFTKKWPRHCVVNEQGASFIPEFDLDHQTDDFLLVDIGATNDIPDYSPFYDQKFQDFMEQRSPEQIFVSGIALEYCVLATCLSSLAYSGRVTALEDFICSAKKDQAELAWSLLEEEGVRRQAGNPFERP